MGGLLNACAELTMQKRTDAADNGRANRKEIIAVLCCAVLCLSRMAARTLAGRPGPPTRMALDDTGREHAGREIKVHG